MNGFEFMLLILGIIVFAVSFFFPFQKEKKSENAAGISEEEIKKLIENRMKDVNSRVDEVVDETIEYAIEKTERAFDRITNEKMSAISDYSDTVLEDIHKNHQEVLFLYDMLNDKHEQLKGAVVLADRAAKKVKNQKEEAKLGDEEESSASFLTKPLTKKVSAEEISSAIPMIKRDLTEKPLPEKRKNNTEAPVTAKSTTKSERKSSANNLQFGPFMAKAISGEEVKDVLPSGKSKGQDAPKHNFEHHFEGMSSMGSEMRNRNEEILAMHSLGKNNVTIAKELGLGVGEVKLVIDLFEKHE